MPTDALSLVVPDSRRVHASGERSVPIVFFGGGRGNVPSIVKAIWGALEFLTKPIDPTPLSPRSTHRSSEIEQRVHNAPNCPNCSAPWPADSARARRAAARGIQAARHTGCRGACNQGGGVGDSAQSDAHKVHEASLAELASSLQNSAFAQAPHKLWRTSPTEGQSRISRFDLVAFKRFPSRPLRLPRATLPRRRAYEIRLDCSAVSSRPGRRQCGR